MGSGSVSNFSLGHRSFTATFTTALPMGSLVTATSTDSSGGTSEFSQCQAVASDGATGSFALTPRFATVEVGNTLASQATWTVPAPCVWRTPIDVRLVDEADGATATQINWDEVTNTFGLGGRAGAFAQGSPGSLATQ